MTNHRQHLADEPRPSRAEAESAAEMARAAVDAGKLPRLADDTPFIAATAIPSGPDGVRCALGSGDGGFGAATLVDGGFFSDANGWSEDAYGGSLELGDLDADGRADLCVRGGDGVWCARSRESGWEAPA